MKFITIVILALVLIGISTQVYFIFKERNQLKTELDGLNSRLALLIKENSDLNSDIEYFSYPENLEKELKAKFNYKRPGEKMMIITP